MAEFDAYIETVVKSAYPGTGKEDVIARITYDTFLKYTYLVSQHYFDIDIMKLSTSFPKITPQESTVLQENINNRIKEDLVEPTVKEIISEDFSKKMIEKKKDYYDKAKELIVYDWIAEGVKQIGKKKENNLEGYKNTLKEDISHRISRLIPNKVPNIRSILNKIYSTIMLTYYHDEIQNTIIEIIQNSREILQPLIKTLEDYKDETFRGLNFSDPNSVKSYFIDKQPIVVNMLKNNIQDTDILVAKNAQEAYSIHQLIALYIYGNLKSKIGDPTFIKRLPVVKRSLEYYESLFTTTAGLASMYTAISVLYAPGTTRDRTKEQIVENKKEEFARLEQVFVDKTQQKEVARLMSIPIKEDAPEKLGRVRALFITWISDLMYETRENFYAAKTPEEAKNVLEDFKNKVEKYKTDYKVIQGLEQKELEAIYTPPAGPTYLGKPKHRGINILEEYEKNISKLLLEAEL